MSRFPKMNPPKPPGPLNKTAYHQVLRELLDNSGILENPSLRQIFECCTADSETDWWYIFFHDLARSCNVTDIDRVIALTHHLAEQLEMYFWHDPEGQKSAYELMVTPATGSVRMDFFTKVTSRLTKQRVFLCHASEDKGVVRRLYRDLSRDGLSPWLDEIQLLPGVDWDHQIGESIRHSRAVLICLSRVSLAKGGFFQREIQMAQHVAGEGPEGSPYIVPLRLEECNVPELLRRYQWVDLFDPSGYDRLISGLRTRLQAARPHERILRLPRLFFGWLARRF